MCGSGNCGGRRRRRRGMVPSGGGRVAVATVVELAWGRRLRGTEREEIEAAVVAQRRRVGRWG